MDNPLLSTCFDVFLAIIIIFSKMNNSVPFAYCLSLSIPRLATGSVCVLYKAESAEAFLYPSNGYLCTRFYD